MPSDQAPKIKTGHRPKWEIPEISDIRIRAMAYEPRAPKNFTNVLEAVKDAVEIVVYLKSPMPVRAMAPVLYVGKTQLTESEALDQEGKQIRFWAFDRAKLSGGAPVTLAWMGEEPPSEKQKTRFTYRAPE